MAPKKKQVKEETGKKVRFTKKNKDENINIISAPQKENYIDDDNLNLDEDELEKEKELEDETEKDDETEKEDDIDEDHELDDEVEHELDEEINDDILEDDLYVGTKTKSSSKKKKVKEEETEDTDLDEDLCDYNYDEIYDEKKELDLVIVDDANRITLPKLTKYERVRLISTRAKQISLGAKVMVKNTKGLNPIEIAKLELEFKMIPMKIRRVLPDNKVEIWKLSELEQ
jgi:DNA-directed RNA polymerase I, II, and III subunit RPABC2